MAFQRSRRASKEHSARRGGQWRERVKIRDPKTITKPNLYGAQEETDLVLDLIDKYQKELRDNSLLLGERIYEERPRQFMRRMKHLWLAWQAHPARKKYRASGKAA